MKFYKGIVKTFYSKQTNTVEFGSNNGIVYSIKNGRLILKEYGTKNRFGYAYYQGEELSVYGRMGDWMGGTLQGFRDEAVWLENNLNQKKNLNEMLSVGLIASLHNKAQQDMTALFVTYEEKRIQFIVSYNLQKNTFISLSSEAMLRSQFEDYCYTTEYIDSFVELKKYDDNLDECWSFKAEGRLPYVKYSRRPLNVKNTIIYNFITQKTRGRRFDGEVFCLNKNDGSLVWKRKFDCQIDDCQLLDENRVVLYTGNELQILDVTTGDTQKTITTDFIIDNSAKFIFIADGYLLLCNEKETCINVYQISDFECVKHLVLPTDSRFKYEPVAVDGKVYLSGGIPALGEGMFVIDLHDLDTTLQFEQEPEFNITPPTKDDGKVLIEVSDIAIDELVRFGEWVIYRQMVDNGINIHRNGYKENKLFNGQVLLKCHNLICDADLKETYKTTMIERIKIIADAVGISGLRCGKGENSVSLQIEFD